MCRTRVFALSLLTALLVLTISSVVDSAAVRNEPKEDEPIAQEEEVFDPEREAADFFRHRGRRSVEYYRELEAEQQRRTASDSRSRSYEQQRRDYEHYLEEERNDRYERQRQYMWRVHHYGGGYSPYYSPYYSSYYSWYR